MTNFTSVTGITGLTRITWVVGSGGTLLQDNCHIIGRTKVCTCSSLKKNSTQSKPLGSTGADLQAQEETGGLRRV